MHGWKDRLDVWSRLSISDLEKRVMDRTLSQVTDMIADHTYEQLVPRHFFPTEAYHTLIAADFDFWNFELLGIERVEYFCEEVTACEALEKFRAEYERLQERERITAGHEEAAKRRQLETEERFREIKHNQQLSAELRQAELEKLQFQSVGEQMMDQLKLERERLKIEEEIAVIRDKKEERERIKQERQNIKEQFERFQENFRQSQQEMVEALRDIKEV